MGPSSRSGISVFSIESMSSHWATESAVKPNRPAGKGTQLGSVLRVAKRADVQATASTYLPRSKSPRETTMMGVPPRHVKIGHVGFTGFHSSMRAAAFPLGFFAIAARCASSSPISRSSW